MNNLQFEHIRNPDFIALVQKLTQNIQRRAAKQIQLLQENPLYPSLNSRRFLLVFGQSVSLTIRGLWDMKKMIRLFGIGSAPTGNMKR